MQIIRKKQRISNRKHKEKNNEKRVVHERKMHNPFLLAGNGKIPNDLFEGNQILWKREKSAELSLVSTPLFNVTARETPL